MGRIVRGPRSQDRYTSVPNETIRDPRLTWEALGLHSWLLSHDEGWETSERRIAAVRGTGRTKVRSMLKPLEEHGYLERKTQSRGDGGRFGDGDWIVHETPVVSKPDHGAETATPPVSEPDHGPVSKPDHTGIKTGPVGTVNRGPKTRPHKKPNYKKPSSSTDHGDATVDNFDDDEVFGLVIEALAAQPGVRNPGAYRRSLRADGDLREAAVASTGTVTERVTAVVASRAKTTGERPNPLRALTDAQREARYAAAEARADFGETA